MDFFTVIENRYSVRGYRPDPVEPEKLEKVLAAAQLAPTACNFQPFQLIVIRRDGREKDLERIYSKRWFRQAPVVIGICAVPEVAWLRHDDKNYAEVDATIVMDHLILAATAQGLGTCWVGAFDVPATREILGLPDEVEPIAFTPIGYPDRERAPFKRKPVKELVRYDRW
jgi:nitroreductase